MQRRPWLDDDRPGEGPSPLHESLETVMRALGGPGVDAIVTVHERWTEIVGPEVARLSRPVSIEDTVLRIRVSVPAWAGHLRWAEQEILSNLEVLVGSGVVSSITVSVGRI